MSKIKNIYFSHLGNGNLVYRESWNVTETCFWWLSNYSNSFIILHQAENSCVHIKLTVSDSLNATTAGVTRSPESFAITSIFESYTKVQQKLNTKTIFSSMFRDFLDIICARIKHIHIHLSKAAECVSIVCNCYLNSINHTTVGQHNMRLTVSLHNFTVLTKNRSPLNHFRHNALQSYIHLTPKYNSSGLGNLFQGTNPNFIQI